MKRQYIWYSLEMVGWLAIFCLSGFLTEPTFDKWVVEGRITLITCLSLLTIFLFIGGIFFLAWFNFYRRQGEDTK